jgi:hypothetical protein
MKKKSRCLCCGHFIRNGSFCLPCVTIYREWKESMDKMYPNSAAIVLRRKRFAEMERECEQ